MYNHNISKALSEKEFMYYNVDNRDKNETPIDQSINRENILILHSHQNFVRNLMNPITPWTRILVKHDPGMGKTALALMIATDLMRLYRMTKTRGDIFIIGFTKEVFIAELLKRPEFGIITHEELDKYKSLRNIASNGTDRDIAALADYESYLRKKINRNPAGYYNFIGYRELFNQLLPGCDNLSESDIFAGIASGKVKPNWELIVRFRNSLVIFDEFHDVYNKNEINNYGIAIKVLFHIYDYTSQYAPTALATTGVDIRDSRIKCIILTATPLNNSPTEIVDLINILIPEHELPSKHFISKSDLFDDIRNLKLGASDILRKLLMGRISFLQDNNPKLFPRKVYEGEKIRIPSSANSLRIRGFTSGHIPYLRFTRCPMSDFHYQIYKSIGEQIGMENYIILDMAFPAPDGGLWRTRDIRHVYSGLTNKQLADLGIVYNKTKTSQIISGSFLELENLERYSAKYAQMVRDLHENLRNDEGKIFINHQYVQGSGVLLIQEILLANGFTTEYGSATERTLCSRCGHVIRDHFTHLSGKKQTTEKHEYTPARFVVYYGDIDQTTLNTSLARFNAPSNTLGYQFRVLIGSKKTNQAMDTNAIQNLWIVHPPPDFSTIIQIIGRASRRRSHKLLPPEKQEVRIRIYTTCFPSDNDNNTLFYEELKYFEKSQDYIVIQEIEQIMNSVAIDSVINKAIIQPGLLRNRDELGSLFYEPDSEYNYVTSTKPRVTNFNTFYIEDEINNIMYIIKRLFIEISQVFIYDDLITQIRSPPFITYFNPEMIEEDNILIALYILLRSDNIYTHPLIKHLYEVSDTQVYRLFNHLNSQIIKDGAEHVIVNIGNYFILFPVTTVTNTIPFLGTNRINNVSIDQESWYRTYTNVDFYTQSLVDTLRLSNEDYLTLKYNFYMKYRDYNLYDMPLSMEVYDLSFHINLCQDCIRYVFNLLTTDMPTTNLHYFYFKMLYFYDKFDLVIFADHLTGSEYLANYSQYIIHKDDKKEFKGKYKVLNDYGDLNRFLMSSFNKSYSNFSFDMDRLNEFINKTSPTGKEIGAKPEDMTLRISPSTKRNKVLDRMLPVGHHIDTLPKFYYLSGTDTWTSVSNFYRTPTNIVENDIVIGYYEKIPGYIDLKFKIRSPIKESRIYKDARIRERGSICAIKKKEELAEIAKELGITENLNNVRSICSEIKTELLFRELIERRKYQRLSDDEKQKTQQVKWFYMFYEPQLS